MLYKVNPVAKCRMTRADRWKKRACVIKYFDFRDNIKLLNIKLKDSGQKIIFYMPMPESWSNKKKNLMRYKPHQQRPDVDNLLKGLMDAVFEEDCTVWNIEAEKRWSDAGGIVIDDKEKDESNK